MTENNKQEKYYSDLDPKPNFAQLELDILDSNIHRKRKKL